MTFLKVVVAVFAFLLFGSVFSRHVDAAMADVATLKITNDSPGTPNPVLKTQTKTLTFNIYLYSVDGEGVEYPATPVGARYFTAIAGPDSEILSCVAGDYSVEISADKHSVWIYAVGDSVNTVTAVTMQVRWTGRGYKTVQLGGTPSATASEYGVQFLDYSTLKAQNTYPVQVGVEVNRLVTQPAGNTDPRDVGWWIQGATTFSASSWDYFVIPIGAGNVSVQAMEVSPANAKALLKWKIIQNSLDMNYPAVQSQPTPSQAHDSATVTPQSYGSYNVILYTDDSDNGDYNAGEEILVCPFVFVKAEFWAPLESLRVGGFDHFGIYKVDDVQYFDTFDDSFDVSTGRDFTLFTRIWGGGPNGHLGIDGISNGSYIDSPIHAGWLQHGFSDTCHVSYYYYDEGEDVEYEGALEYPLDPALGVNFPLLDNADQENTWDGGISDFNNAYFGDGYEDYVAAYDKEHGGGVVRVSCGNDSPSIDLWDFFDFDNGGGEIGAVQVTGAFSFKAYGAVVGTFPHVYASAGYVPWSVVFDYSWVGDGWDITPNTTPGQFLGVPVTFPAIAPLTTGIKQPNWNWSWIYNYYDLNLP